MKSSLALPKGSTSSTRIYLQGPFSNCPKNPRARLLHISITRKGEDIKAEEFKLRPEKSPEAEKWYTNIILLMATRNPVNSQKIEVG